MMNTVQSVLFIIRMVCNAQSRITSNMDYWILPRDTRFRPSRILFYGSTMSSRLPFIPYLSNLSLYPMLVSFSVSKSELQYVYLLFKNTADHSHLHCRQWIHCIPKSCALVHPLHRLNSLKYCTPPACTWSFTDGWMACGRKNYGSIRLMRSIYQLHASQQPLERFL